MLTSCSAPMYLVTSKSFALGWCTIHWNKYWNFGNFFLYNSLGLNSEYPKKHIKRVEQIFSTFLLQDKFQRKTSFPCFSTWQPESCVSASVCLSVKCVWAKWEKNSVRVSERGKDEVFAWERDEVCVWEKERGKEMEMKCVRDRKRKRGVCLRVWGRERKREGERDPISKAKWKWECG